MTDIDSKYAKISQSRHALIGCFVNAVSTLVVALVMVMMKLGDVKLLTRLLQKLLEQNQLLFVHRFLTFPVFFILSYLFIGDMRLVWWLKWGN